MGVTSVRLRTFLFPFEPGCFLSLTTGSFGIARFVDKEPTTSCLLHGSSVSFRVKKRGPPLCSFHFRYSPLVFLGTLTTRAHTVGKVEFRNAGIYFKRGTSDQQRKNRPDMFFHFPASSCTGAKATGVFRQSEAAVHWTRIISLPLISEATGGFEIVLFLFSF